MKKLLASLLLLVAPATAHADAVADAQYALREAARYLDGRANPPTKADVSEYNKDGDGEYFIGYGTECKKAVDAAIAAGAAKDAVVKVNDAEITIEAARATYCDGLVAYGTAFEKVIDEVVYERWKKVAAKYEAIGIKGDRLALFVWYEQYNVEFYTKGCQYTTGDPKELKKAKVLFDWLDGDDGLITIRKYKFKGDKYTVTEKQFYDPAKAYKACK